MDEGYILNAHRNRVTLSLYYGMRVVLILGALVFLFEQQFLTALRTGFIFLLMFLPSLLQRRYRIYIPFAADFCIVAFIFLTLFLGHIQNFYNRVPMWDKLLHFLSGLILAILGFVVVYLLNKHERLHLTVSPLFVGIFAVTFAVTVASVWEIGEFFFDMFFHHGWQADMTDTMWDLTLDTIGAIIVSTGAYLWMRVHSRLPFTPSFFRLFHRRPTQAFVRSEKKKPELVS
jgi:hypothetical protein